LAAQIWKRLADGYPASPEAEDAGHLAGIALFRSGDYAGAEGFFGYKTASTSAYLRSRALFWTGKSHAARGDSGGANSAFTEAGAADPTGYYSERAKDILAGRTAFDADGTLNVAVEPDTEYREAEAWLLAAWPQAEPVPVETHYALVDSDARLTRGRLLWDLGLYDAALAEFTALRTSLAADPVATLHLSRYLYDIGCYPGAIYSARQVLDALGYSDAQTLTAPIYFSHLRFGPYFADLLIPQAVKYNLDPLLLFALVRQESKFGLTAISPASARGLMQLIPSTAESMADLLGMTGYSQGDLYRPVINVQLGSVYLAQQRDWFDGDVFAALAAYNGGPPAASAWWNLAGGDDDLFVEIIQYGETRDYLRFVYEQFVIYRDLYTAP
jgi:soluble lytic murein transglycosylase